MKPLIYTMLIITLASCAKNASTNITPTAPITGKWIGKSFNVQYDSLQFTEFVTNDIKYNYDFEGNRVTKTYIQFGTEHPFYTGTYVVTGNQLAVTIDNAGVDTYTINTLNDNSLILNSAIPTYKTLGGFITSAINYEGYVR